MRSRKLLGRKHLKNILTKVVILRSLRILLLPMKYLAILKKGSFMTNTAKRDLEKVAVELKALVTFSTCSAWEVANRVDLVDQRRLNLMLNKWK